jgi:hypothetical protein
MHDGTQFPRLAGGSPSPEPPQTGTYYLIEYGSDLDLWKMGGPNWHNCLDFRKSEIPLVQAQIGACDETLRSNPNGCDIVLPRNGGPGFTLIWRPTNPTHGLLECRDGREEVSSSLFLTGVGRQAERKALNAFNSFARGKRRIRYSPETPGIASLKQRPLCVTVYRIDKNDLRHGFALLAVKAFAVAFFRSRFVA